MTAMTIGFVGLGNMGNPMSARLVTAGHRVIGFDLAEAARAALVAAGGESAESLDALTPCDVVILMLPNSAVVESVLFESGLAGVLSGGSTVIDMSSSEPLRTTEVAARLAEAGIPLVDAPVSGGVKGAVNGTLTIMAGGSDAQIAAVAPVLSELGKVRHVGPVGAGHALKAINNLMSATHLWVTSEAMSTGITFGLDPAVMLEAINGSSGRSGSTENKWPNFVLPGGYDSGFGLRLMLKDMKIALGLAETLGVPSSLSADAVELWQHAADELPADADHTMVAKWILDRSGSGAAAARERVS